MGVYKYLQQLYHKPTAEFSVYLKHRLIRWRREEVIVRLEHPTRLDRAHALGYRAKPGYFLVRVRVQRGGRMRPHFMSGRKSRQMRRRKVVGKSYQWVAEERAARTFKNAEVLNSYGIAKDGLYAWYEVILADRQTVARYPGMAWLAQKRGRAFRGKTSAGRRSRGLLNKGVGAEKLRPSLRAHDRLKA